MPASKKERQSAKERIQRTEAYANKVRQQFAGAVNDILALNKRLPELKEGQMYSFDGAGKKMQREVDAVLRDLHSATVTTIRAGIRQEWTEANKAVDEILATALGRKALSNPDLAGWFDRGEKAMDAFMRRTQDGFNLSRRIWNTTTQLREEMEVAMTVAIGEGESASQMSRRVRQYLDDPDLMFRRFRYKDENGEWRRKWKKKVVDADGRYHFVDYDRDDYKVGRGMYKSAYKNAMRVTRTETNIAYRRADHERWQGLDFVLGQRIQVSGSHPKDDICDELAGDYPKDFVFDGWHPQCFCICTPIMADEEEMRREMEAALNGEEYTPNYEPIETYPEGFQEFLDDNREKIVQAQKAGTAPYFIANNEEVVRRRWEGQDLTQAQEKELTPMERAELRHKSRTPEQVQDIKDRWAKTLEAHEKTRQDAKDALETAKEYHEVDTAELEKQTKAGNLTSMRRQTEAVQKAIEEQKEEEKKLGDIIPDVHKWHQRFTLEQLRGVHDSVEKKLGGWSSLPLAEQAKKLDFEANEYFGKNMGNVQGKYSTWEVAQAAYLEQIESVKTKIEVNKCQNTLDTIGTYLADHKGAKSLLNLYSEAGKAISNGGELSEIQQKVALAEQAYQRNLKAQATRAQKSSLKPVSFGDECFTQDRKNNAIWAQSTKDADKALRATCGDVWRKASKEEKDAIYGYTDSYHNIQEPLRGLTYYGSQRDRDTGLKRIPYVTSIIDKSSYGFDMWVQRGDGLVSLKKFGITNYASIRSASQIKHLVGAEGTEGGFWSAGVAKGKGFTNKPVIYNIYAPKGTKMMYCEPFSAYGKGGKRNWDGKSPQSSFGDESEILIQRGTTYKITKVSESGGQIYIDVEVRRQEPLPFPYKNGFPYR